VSVSARRWSFPGGGLKRGEDPAQCARRELREELGCEAGELTLLATLSEQLQGAEHTAHVFAVVLASTPRPDGREVIEARLFELDALPPLSTFAQRRLSLWLAHRVSTAV
jgi:ADP-ribose pyrophosphatase YjhB (NUDIX family)